MKNQIYIFLATIIILFSCKTDNIAIEPDNIFYWDLGDKTIFHRDDTIIDVKSEIIAPFRVDFESYSANSYQISFNGGDSLLFYNNNNCETFSPFGLNIDSTLEYSTTLRVDKKNNGISICNNDSAFYIAFKRTYKNQYKTNYGWFKVLKPIEGFWQIDDFAYNLTNHGQIKVGQKE